MRVLCIPIAATMAMALAFSAILTAQEYDLTAAQNWQFMNVEATPTEYQNRKALRVVAQSSAAGSQGECLAILPDIDFKNGTIELELAGKPRTSAGGTARGFIGVAFRVQKDDPRNYEAFYLRPTNGRAEDQLRRNHSVQYISHPQYTWSKLREEFPGKYESYADLEPGKWTKVKIVVNGLDARLFVGGAAQPCLIVQDLKRGEQSGAVALWIEPSTEAYFRALRVSEHASLSN